MLTKADVARFDEKVTFQIYTGLSGESGILVKGMTVQQFLGLIDLAKDYYELFEDNSPSPNDITGPSC